MQRLLAPKAPAIHGLRGVSPMVTTVIVAKVGRTAGLHVHACCWRISGSTGAFERCHDPARPITKTGNTLSEPA